MKKTVLVGSIYIPGHLRPGTLFKFRNSSTVYVVGGGGNLIRV